MRALLQNASADHRWGRRCGSGLSEREAPSGRRARRRRAMSRISKHASKRCGTPLARPEHPGTPGRDPVDAGEVQPQHIADAPHLVMDRRAGAPHGALARDLAVELEPVQLVAVERGDVLLGLTGGHVLDLLHRKPQSLREGARPCALIYVHLCRYAHAQTRRCADAHVHTHADISEEARGRAMRSPHRRATGPAPRGRR